MVRIYTPYWEWEDWQNGMWGKSDNEEDDLVRAVDFTGDCKLYGKAMQDVIKLWPRTMLNTLTNTSANRRAFLGHCAVSFRLKIPEYITRKAWGLLTDRQRVCADKVAQYHINKWIIEHEKQNRKIYPGMGKQMLLQWYTR